MSSSVAWVGRPPEPCPQDAKYLISALGLRNPTGGALAEIDANHRRTERLTLFSGPVESVLVDPLGPIREGSRFYGRIWITQRGVVIRYYHAQMIRGDVIPICAVARRDADEMKSSPGGYPGSAELELRRMDLHRRGFSLSGRAEGLA